MSSSDPSPEPTLDAALQALGLDGVDESEPVAIATDTRVWRVTQGGRPLAIRMLRPEQSRVAQREIEAMRHARKHGIPAPAVVATGMVDERHPAMALAWMPGEPATQALLRDYRLATRLGQSAGRLLARLHQLPVGVEQSVSQYTPGVPQLKDSPPRPSLLHLDYHPFNLMATGSRVSAVLDWTNAAHGDPRADIARSVSLLRVVAPEVVGRRGARRYSIGLFTRGFLEGYTAGDRPLTDMAPFYAWAGEMLMKDLAPKLDRLPVDDPDALYWRMRAWTERFQAE